MAISDLLNRLDITRRSSSAGTSSGGPLTVATQDSGERLGSIMDDGRNEANRLQAEEERRGFNAEALLRQRDEAASVPTMSGEDILAMTARARDESGTQHLSNMRNLNAYVHGAGLTGGSWVGGMASRYEGERQDANLATRRDLFLEKSKSDAWDRVQGFQRGQVRAEQMTRDVAMQRMDWMGNEASLLMTDRAIDAQLQAARMQAEAARSAGEQSFMGDLIGGGLGLAGAAIGLL